MKQAFKKFWRLILLFILGVGGLLWYLNINQKQVILSPEAPWMQIEKPLEKYSFPELKNRVFNGSEIELGKILQDNNSYVSRVFYYKVEDRKISGQINIPKTKKPVNGYPVIVMIRGYVDREIYEIGVGTKNGAGYFSNNGFMTLAPDFLGYGESDMPPNNSLEERFMRPMQMMELIVSVKNLDSADEKKIAMWGHSNGGQIALSVLEISGKKIPTSLWAPVSKPFPYSILYYTDEFDDRGRALRKVVAGFEALYEADEYSIENYYDWIKAEIQIHQGTVDDAVPIEWSEELNKKLKELDKNVKLFIYSGVDHNLRGPTSPPVGGFRGASGWDEAVARDLEFFRKEGRWQ